MSICSCTVCGRWDYCDNARELVPMPQLIREDIEFCEGCKVRIWKVNAMMVRMPRASLDDMFTRAAYEEARDTAECEAFAGRGPCTFLDFHETELARIKRAWGYLEAAFNRQP